MQINIYFTNNRGSKMKNVSIKSLVVLVAIIFFYGFSNTVVAQTNTQADFKTYKGTAFEIGIEPKDVEFYEWDISKAIPQEEIRAYVTAEIISNGFEQVISNGFEQVKGKDAVKFRLVNNGKTPAQHVRVDGQIKVCEYPLTRTKVEYDSVPNANQRWTIYPNQSTKHSTGYIFADSFLNLTTENIKRITSSKDERVFLFIRIWYVDVYGATHSRKICRFIESGELTESGSIKNINWADYKDFNDFD